MTELQKKLLNLTDEIKDICKKEKLNYVVAGMTAGFILNNKHFKAEECYFNIMMPLKDIVKLEKYVNKNLSSTRVIESWKNNPDLQMLKFRYVDKTTLLFDGGSAERHICHGIHINIFPSREFEPANDVRGIERYIQLDNLHQANLAKWIMIFKLATRVTHLNVFKRYIMHFVKLENVNYIHKGFLKSRKMSKEEMINYVIEENLKAVKPYTSNRFIPEEKRLKEPSLTENCLAYMTDRSRVVKLPIDLYTNVKEVEFEDRTFKVYAEPEKYFDSLYKADWQNKIKEELMCADRTTVVCDPELPYEEYLEYIKNDKVTLADIADSKFEYNTWMGKVHNPAVNKTWHTFMMARRGVDRIDTWYRLRNKREQLKEAYEANDLPKLKKLMKGYISATDRYLAEKIGFYIDDELFKYATVIWESEERPDKKDREGNAISFAQYVYSLVPDLYKSETPDMYFKSRNKTFD